MMDGNNVVSDGHKLKVLLLECTNLSPYQKAITKHSNVMVHDICSLIKLI